MLVDARSQGIDPDYPLRGTHEQVWREHLYMEGCKPVFDSVESGGWPFPHFLSPNPEGRVFSFYWEE